MIVKRNLICTKKVEQGSELSMHRIELIDQQMYQHNLMHKYNEINKEYNILKTKTKKVYDENVLKKEYYYKLKYNVDDISINKEDEELYIQYENDKNNAIRNYLFTGNFNERKVEKLFNVRLKSLKRKSEKVNVNNIGTILNAINDFKHDLFMDIDRNKHNIKEHNNQVSPLWIDFKEAEIQYNSEKKVNYKFSLS